MTPWPPLHNSLETIKLHRYPFPQLNSLIPTLRKYHFQDGKLRNMARIQFFLSGMILFDLKPHGKFRFTSLLVTMTGTPWTVMHSLLTTSAREMSSLTPVRSYFLTMKSIARDLLNPSPSEQHLITSSIDRRQALFTMRGRFLSRGSTSIAPAAPRLKAGTVDYQTISKIDHLRYVRNEEADPNHNLAQVTRIN